MNVVFIVPAISVKQSRQNASLYRGSTLNAAPHDELRTNNDADRSVFLAAALCTHAEFTAKKNHCLTGWIAEESGHPGRLWRSMAKILRRDDQSTSAAPRAQTAGDFGDNAQSVRADNTD